MSSFEDRFLAEVTDMEATRARAKASWAAWEQERQQADAEAAVLLREYARRFAHWANINGVRPPTGRHWVVREAQTMAVDDPSGPKYATKLIQVNPAFLIYGDGRVSPERTWVKILYDWAKTWHRIDLSTLPPAPAVIRPTWMI